MCACVRAWHSLDDMVVRSLLGKVLSKNLRRDIDEIATATSTRLASARRQFDNLKRILKHVEQIVARHRADGTTPRRPMLNAIMEDFLLPVELASHYLNAIFLCVNRVETFKGRLAVLDLNQVPARVLCVCARARTCLFPGVRACVSECVRACVCV